LDCDLLGYGGQDCDELFMCPFSSVRRSEQDAAFDKKKKIKGNSLKSPFPQYHRTEGEQQERAQ
jgi:hypothetical protein